jgi:hypothetical protein
MKNPLLRDQPDATVALPIATRRTSPSQVRSWINHLLAIVLTAGGALTSLSAAQTDAPVLLIAQPSDQETIHNNSGEVPVVVTLHGMNITAGWHLRVLLDDKLHAAKIHTLSFLIEGIDRGAHSLRVELIDEANAVVATSPTHTFYLWQASRLFPVPSR